MVELKTARDMEIRRLDDITSTSLLLNREMHKRGVRSDKEFFEQLERINEIYLAGIERIFLEYIRGLKKDQAAQVGIL